MSLRILCDVDGVLADFVGLVQDYVQRNTGMSVRREAIDQWDCFAAVNLREHWPYFRRQCDELGLCRSMRLMPGAKQLWAAILAIDPKAKVCTTPMTVAWLSQRAAWLEAEMSIPLAQQWHGHGKEDLTRPEGWAVGFDILIDDKVENCEDFAHAGGYAFCIAAPYNTHVGRELDIPRGDWRACVEWLRAFVDVPKPKVQI